MTPLEIKGAVAGVTTSVFILVATFTTDGLYRNSIERETEPGNKPLDAAALAAKGRTFFFQSCARGSEIQLVPSRGGRRPSGHPGRMGFWSVDGESKSFSS